MPSNAQLDADETIKELLNSQPNLISPTTPNAATGANVAGFIKALREALVTMYTAHPKHD